VASESGGVQSEAGLGPLKALRDQPARAAILTDVDGTLAPIVVRPEEAAVSARASELLALLSARYALVGCISGRQAEEARRLVGVDGIAYAGNHGLELLLPGEDKPHFDPALAGHDGDAAVFVAGLATDDLTAAGIRLEDKGPIQSLHWRGARDEEAAEAWARELGAEAERAGLATRPGRKVLELRPAKGGGKDAAVQALLSTTQVTAATYAGDDRTDLDVFRRLRKLQRGSALEVAICVGVGSDEGPAELVEEADLTVDGPEGWLTLLEQLAE
jgi:trehalose 6-phosphate phosphatase